MIRKGPLLIMVWGGPVLGWIRNPRRDPSGPVVTASGRELAATVLATLFGFGFCIYDKQDADGNFILKGEYPHRTIVNGLAIGFLRFVPDEVRAR